jgi:2-oxoglutarate ferredoxin oxidoreductase subunit alpha
MVHDVRLAINARRSVGFYGRQGGMVPSPAEVFEVLRDPSKEHQSYAACV